MENRILFETTGDFELGLIKERETDYFIYNSEYNDGLIVYIPGFGGDLGDYAKNFCSSVSKKYRLASLMVNYFCIGSRPQTGATINIYPEENEKLQQFFMDLGGHGEASLEALVKQLLNNHQGLKSELRLRGVLTPPKGEYQNFGIMAALDVINAIKDAVRRFKINQDQIVIVGSSYGGYVANLVTKIYPGLVKAVFDNSAWANPNILYAVGAELGISEYRAYLHPELSLDLSVKSPWTSKAGLPNSFSGGRLEIRSFSKPQLSRMHEQGGKDTFYVFYHAEGDLVAITEEKIMMAQNMVELGFKHIMMNVVNESEIDGKLIKNMSHGMGMSMLTFFDVCFQFLLDVNPAFKFNDDIEQAVYEMDDLVYRFDLTGNFATGIVLPQG